MTSSKAQAETLAKDLALKGESGRFIAAALRNRGWEDELDALRIQEIVTEVAAMTRLAGAEESNKRFVRIVGMVAVLLGVAALWLTVSGSTKTPRRHTPACLGLVALVLGSVMLCKPSSASEDV